MIKRFLVGECATTVSENSKYGLVLLEQLQSQMIALDFDR